MRVICPLFQEYIDTHIVQKAGELKNIEKEIVRKCWENECAWWDKEDKRCAILTIARKLEGIRSGLER